MAFMLGIRKMHRCKDLMVHDVEARLVPKLPTQTCGPLDAWSHRPTPLGRDQLSRFSRILKIESPASCDQQDFVSIFSHSVIVSERIKETIENLEPDVHQFILLETIFRPRYANYFQGIKYYFLNICQLIDAVVVEQSVVRRHEMYPKEAFEIEPDLKQIITIHPCVNESNEYVVTLDANAINNRHLWQGPEHKFNHEIFISKQLKSEWDLLGAGPMDYVKCRVT